MTRNASTLTGGERRLAPAVWLLLGTCLGVSAWLFHLSLAPLALALWAVPTALNLLYLVRHGRPTVGMAPVAVASLAPAAASSLCAPHLTPPVRGVCGVILALALGVVGLFLVWFVRLSRAYLHREEPADDAVVIVLGGAVHKGQPRPTLALRLDVALRLVAKAPGRTLVLTGGPVPNEPGTEAGAMARYLVQRGVPRKQLVLEQRALNTRQNILYSLELVRERGLVGQPCVLTSDYHLYRALAEARGLGAELVPVPAPTPLPGRLQQWCREVLTILVRR